MAGNVQTIAAGVSDRAQVPAVSKVSPNQRLSATTGTLGTVADVLMVPGAVPPFTAVGNWVSPNMGVFDIGLPNMSQSSFGTGVNAVGVPTGPMTVKITDPRISAH